MLVDLDAIPRREPGLEPFEVMISESQERMVAIVEPGRWEAVRAVCERWDLPVAIIGRVTAEPDIVVLTGPGADGRARRRRPARRTGPRSSRGSRPPRWRPGAIVFQRESRPPARRRAAPAPGAPVEPVDTLPAPRPGPRRRAPGAARLAQPLVAPRACSSSTTTTSRRTRSPGPGRGAAVLRIKGTTKALVASTDANAPVGALDPWLGAAMSVAEAARNVAITGARPLGVTNCLNFGDPTRPEAFWQLTEAVRGLSDACLALGLPVTGRQRVAVQRVARRGDRPRRPRSASSACSRTSAKRVGPAFRAEGNAVLLVGQAGAGLAGSEYARLAGAAPEDGPPAIDLERERSLQAFIREAVDRGLVESCQDVSGGGLAVAVAEMAIWSDVGALLRLTVGDSPAVGLFGESPSRLIVEVAPRHVPAFILLARQHGLPGDELGTTGGSRLVIELAGRGRHRRGRGAREPDRRRARRRDRRPAARLGPRPAARARLGGPRLMCGVVGVVLPDRGHEAAGVAATALFALQHRGQESAGVGVSDGRNLMIYKDLGMVGQVLDERRIPSLAGDLAVAHCRYSTTGSTVWENAQPTLRLGPRRALAIGHNGNLVNTRELLGQLEGGRGRLPASTDTELLTALLADEPADDTVDALCKVLPRVKGAFSLVILSEHQVIGVRDPHGFRPLVLGRLPISGDGTDGPGLWGDDTAGWILASETAALDIVGAEFVRDVEPGEIVVLEPGREPVSVTLRRPPRRPCACSSSSTSRAPTRTWRAATCTRRAATWACSSRSSTPSTPTS